MKEIARNCLSNITYVHIPASTSYLYAGYAYVIYITQPQLRFCWGYQTSHSRNWGSVGHIRHYTATTEVLLGTSNITQPQLRFCWWYQTSHSHNWDFVWNIKHRTATTVVLLGISNIAQPLQRFCLGWQCRNRTKFSCTNAKPYIFEHTMAFF